MFFECAVIVGHASERFSAAEVNKPDYGSGPYLALMAAAVRLARLDLANPVYSAEARAWLRSDIVALFADCLGFEGEFDA